VRYHAFLLHPGLWAQHSHLVVRALFKVLRECVAPITIVEA
jgi:hypothetical protein